MLHISSALAYCASHDTRYAETPDPVVSDNDCPRLGAYLKWSLRLARWARANFDLVLSVLEEGPHNVAASGAVELDHLQLREDACPSGDHPLELDQ